MLEWNRAPYKVMARGDNHANTYLVINPSGQVPALRLDERRVLTGALAILAFLDDEHQLQALRVRAFVVRAPMLQTLEERLGGGRFILSGRRSVADAYLYVLLRWAGNAPAALIADLSVEVGAMPADGQAPLRLSATEAEVAATAR